MHKAPWQPEATILTKASPQTLFSEFKCFLFLRLPVFDYFQSLYDSTKVHNRSVQKSDHSAARLVCDFWIAALCFLCFQFRGNKNKAKSNHKVLVGSSSPPSPLPLLNSERSVYKKVQKEALLFAFCLWNADFPLNIPFPWSPGSPLLMTAPGLNPRFTLPINHSQSCRVFRPNLCHLSPPPSSMCTQTLDRSTFNGFNISLPSVVPTVCLLPSNPRGIGPFQPPTSCCWAAWGEACF